MTSSFDEEIPAAPTTHRGRDWPCLRQFGIFLENRVGLLHDLLRQLERHDLRIVALSVQDSIDYAVARLVVNQYERARELISLADFPFFETDVIAVELPDADQPHVRICGSLMKAELNINYTYPLLYRRNGRGGIALFVDDIDEGIRVLQEDGLKIITEHDLTEDDEFFG